MRIVVSELAILETMVLPLRLRNPALIADYESFFAMPVIEQWPVDRQVLLEGARLRAELMSLRTADAIHAATAKLSGCDSMFTNDVALRRLTGIQVYIAQDFIEASEVRALMERYYQQIGQPWQLAVSSD